MQQCASAPPTDDCLRWPYRTNRDGYGLVEVDGVGRPAHRRVLIATTGHDPSDREAAHRCGTPSCLNPDHLYWATPAQNGADKRVHGTGKGTRNGRSKLSEADVDEIRRRYAAGETQVALAAVFPVNQSTISQIVRGAKWVHV